MRPGNNAGDGPFAIVVMGVSGCGKSTLGAALADRLHAPFLEGDTFHSHEAVAKMQAGRPLDDADRWPWLDRLGAAIAEATHGGGTVVAACSALKRAYRDRLAQAAGLRPRYVLLEAGRAELARRLAARAHHYMPASLLDSQLATLEPPGADERAIVLDATACVTALTRAVLDELHLSLPHGG